MRAETRILDAAAAVRLIPDGATLAVSGFVGAGHPEHLTKALRERFDREGSPHGLTLVYAAGQGDGNSRGLNHLAAEGLLKRVVGGHWNLAPALGRLALENRIEAYNLPQGVISVLFREIAAGRPGVFTQVGLHTFIDPRQTGGRLNERTTESLVELVKLGGEEWMWYSAFPVNAALIRATRADRRGNLSMEDEGLIGEVLPIAQAARNHGGVVIAQVREVVDRICDPKAVRVPGLLVDAVVVAPEEDHQQTFSESFNPSYVGASADFDAAEGATPFSERLIIGRRALAELHSGNVVNLGIGLPEFVAVAAREAGRLSEITLTVESGPTGGSPASGLSFGCASDPEAIIDQPSQFDFYDGGGLDVAVLGALEVDEEGSVSVSQVNGRFAGVGGFVNISHCAKRLVFCFTLRAGGLRVATRHGKLQIDREGDHCKMVPHVHQVCFHGPTARSRGQDVLYVTERAVFRLAADGLELIELALGCDLQTQVLDQMGFRPVRISTNPMPVSCFLNT